MFLASSFNLKTIKDTTRNFEYVKEQLQDNGHYSENNIFGVMALLTGLNFSLNKKRKINKKNVITLITTYNPYAPIAQMILNNFLRIFTNKPSILYHHCLQHPALAQKRPYAQQHQRTNYKCEQNKWTSQNQIRLLVTYLIYNLWCNSLAHSQN